ncbi:SPT3 Dosage dependent suppressor of Ty-induced promoter mutations-like protein [Steccherinum ochraceum]|uniref:SPT3 Dosage dependent suppressor of Ty-induced promoter mutations-like protein n=1 Tax=Steccherinum ochraceum TaxID=92696 RepID=A0A4R0RK18_9APHY|nr:SPT3 Dosage dependent suppressor of Ty-induced promoter mutations-like protein [Steccherinum ochraceum]
MSSSSTTACSRSPSPATPATPDSDNIDNVVTQEDLAAWCHSLSPAGFLIGEESTFSTATAALKKTVSHPLKLEDISQDATDSPAPAGSDASSNFLLSRSPSVSLPMGIEVADLVNNARNSITSTRPVPPPLSHIRRDAAAGSQCVVYPPKESCYNLPIMVPSIPEGGTKSRVETQVRLTVDLAHASSSSGEPLKYDRVGSWKWLRLPKGTSTKRRARKEAKIDAPSEDTLHLTTDVTCATPPNTRVTCCSSCQGREAKRVARKLAARVRPARSDSESPDDVTIIPGRGKHEDTTNLVQFNCPEILDFSSGSVVLPLRITCYCRHHREKVGFNVHFTMLDHNGRIVGSGTTRPIMITDDHKSTGVNAKNQTRTADTSPNPEWPYGAVGDLPDSGAAAAKRKNSRADTTDRTKKRTKPYDSAARSGGNLRRRGSNASLDSAQSPLASTVGTRAPTRSPTPAQLLQHGPILHAAEQHASPEPIDPSAAEVAATILAALEHPVTPADEVGTNTFEDILMPDAPSQLELDLEHTFSLDELGSSFFNTDPSSSTPMASDPVQAPSPLSQAQAAVSYMLFNNDPPPPINSLPPPKIHRLIPAMGPTYGGIEVTVLGANFHPAMQLNCVFGDLVSSSTQRWSENTLVCILPPSTSPGVVGVWFDGVEKQDDGSPPVLFTYTDETDRALMELALQVVGLKMTGKIEDARNVAMRIVTTTGPEDTPGTMEPNNAMQLAAGPSTSTPADIRRLLLSSAGGTPDFEQLILDSLAVMDVPTAGSLPSADAIISLATASGQTLLHLASRLNFSKVTQFLLDREIDLDARDRSGCTALHHAAMMGSTECARLLIEAGAALDIVDARGKTPAEVAQPGFIGNFHTMHQRRQRGWSFREEGEEEEEEAAFADGEEDESEADGVPTRSVPKRRATLERRNSAMREKPLSRRPSTEFGKGKKREELIPEVPPFPLDAHSAQAKAAEAGIVDEKQMMATIMDMVQRTLHQIQHPNLPQLPQLPGMPAWGALPQMPAVFPVYVPMAALPSISALWGDKQRPDSVPQGAEEKTWRAVWEKWVAMTARSNGDEAPPAYTPREDGAVLSDDVKAKLEQEKGVPSASVEEVAEVPQAEIPSPSTSAPETISRRVGYAEETPVPEVEVKSYGYRPSKKQSRRSQKKADDRMLILFWVPVLLIGLIWAVLHTMRVGLGAVKAVVTIHAGLRT